MSPSIFNWSKIEYLQDWPTWVKNGWVDMVCPQVYRYQFERYQKEIALIKQQVGEEKLKTMVFPGILLRVFRVDKLPTHQSSSLPHSSTEADKPSRIDSRMPGIDNR